MVRMMRGFMRTRADVIFFPATYSFVPVPFTRVVVTAHDAIAERMPDLVVPRRSDRWRWAAKQHLALRQAKVVVTVSSAARDDLVDVLHVPPSRVRVVAEAAHPRFKPPAVSGGTTPTSLGPVDGRPYFLYVGGFSPHKNLVALVRAFDRVADRDPTVALVLAGDIEDDPFLSSASDVQHAIAGARNRHRVRITGYVDDAELVSLYQHAVASVLVSFGEGFGLPVAESMACGTPVIVSDEPALRENAGDAGYYLDPRDTSEIEAAMVDLLTDRSARDRRVAAGLLRSRERSWAHSAECVLSVLEEVAR